jgi:hypothetical protein
MQELMVYSAQSDSYENCNEVLAKYTNIEVSATQVWRVANVYGAEVGKTLNDEVNLTPCKKDEVVYAMADGSMLFTREEGWKEVKVGRIFKSSDCIHAEGKAGCISHSQYIAHLGGHQVFTAEMEKLLDKYVSRKQPIVFLSDGATWIKNWVEDAYPQAISILDFYHALEHLHDFGKEVLKDEDARKKWVEQCKAMLLEGQVKSVMKEVAKFDSTHHKEASKLIEYYRSNERRMNYPAYKKIGAGIIGSGAIESAHRTVVQKRMKQSGQRWGKQGAQNMLNLRVVNKNKQWAKIVQLTKCDFLGRAA